MEKNYTDIDSRRLYSSQIEEYPVISREREDFLAEKIKAATKLPEGKIVSVEGELVINGLLALSGHQFEPASAETLAVEAEAIEARKELIRANLRHVVAVVNRHEHGHGIEELDAIQSGNIGLIVAVDQFDPERGNRIITYADAKIKREIQRQKPKESTIKIPDSQSSLQNKIYRIRHDYFNRHGQDPSYHQIIDELGELPENEIETAKAILRASQPVDSLEKSLNSDDFQGKTLKETVSLRDISSQDAYEDVEDRHDIFTAMASAGLTSKEELTINMHYCQGYTPTEIAVMEGVSRQAIDQRLFAAEYKIYQKLVPPDQRETKPFKPQKIDK